MAEGRQPQSARRIVAVVAGALAAGFLLARCSAEGTPAPDLAPEDQPKPSLCKPVREQMPHFFALLEQHELQGLRDVVVRLTEDSPAGDSPVAGLLSNAVRGLKDFTKDPPESTDEKCLAAPPDAELCTIEAGPGDACENRMCASRRALDFGIRDDQAASALDDLQPILGKVLGYVSNHGPGADGKTHYEVIDVFHRTSAPENEGICAPENLLDVLDGIVVYFRNHQACTPNCPGQQAMTALKQLLNDPQLQTLLQTFASASQDGAGRSAWQSLAKVLGPALEGLPTDEHYWDPIQPTIDQINNFLDRDPDKYGQLKTELNAMVKIAKDLLNPDRKHAILVPLTHVVQCLDHVDTNEDVVGAIFDLLSQQGGADGKGLDLKEVVNALDKLNQLDGQGVLFGAAHTILASTRSDEQARDNLRQLLADAFTEQNAQDAIPVLQEMVDQGVIKELVSVIDNLLYGCKTDGT